MKFFFWDALEGVAWIYPWGRVYLLVFSSFSPIHRIYSKQYSLCLLVVKALIPSSLQCVVSHRSMPRICIFRRAPSKSSKRVEKCILDNISFFMQYEVSMWSNCCLPATVYLMPVSPGKRMNALCLCANRREQCRSSSHGLGLGLGFFTYAEISKFEWTVSGISETLRITKTIWLLYKTLLIIYTY